MPPGWEDADLSIQNFSQLPHCSLGNNQHISIAQDFRESLRQVLWGFRAPIRYAFAYGSGVFAQSTGISQTLSPHPHPPEAVIKWQRTGGKVIDYIFGVSFTQHWHDINIQQHPQHYSILKRLGSYPISKIQDSWGAGVYFNPYINIDGIMIKYGVVNLDTLCKDLTDWNTLYLAGRLQKPVKILRDDARVRLANQMNLMSAVRTALLMLPAQFNERQLYHAIAGLSYLGDPRMSLGGEDPSKVSNIVGNQLASFRQVYVPLVDNLPNVSFDDPRVPSDIGWEIQAATSAVLTDLDSHKIAPNENTGYRMAQDMDIQRRANMVRRLPRAFRKKLYHRYQQKFQIPGSAFDEIIDSADESADGAEQGFRPQLGGDFERRIAAQDDIADVVRRCVRDTVAWPSTSQSLKGVFTSGVSRSYRYYSEKRAKGRQAAVKG